MSNCIRKFIPKLILGSAILLIPLSNTGALEIKSSNDKASVSLYGQVNRAAMKVDDGNQSDTFHVDNDNSSTRIGIKAKAVKGDLTIGARWEIEYESDSSAEMAMNNAGAVTGDYDGAEERQMKVYLDHNKFGKLTLGQGDTASNGTSEVDLSGTGIIGKSEVVTLGKSFLFYDSLAKAYSAVDVGDAFSNMDGFSRKDMIRYDTLKFGGFSFAASSHNDNNETNRDIALRYSGEISGVKLAAAAAYLYYDSAAAEDSGMNGSFSVLFPMGLNLTVASGKTDMVAANRTAQKFSYGKLGYKAKLNSLGDTAFSVDYGTFDDQDAQDDKGKSVGFQFVQKLSDWSSEAYMGYRKYELDRIGTEYEDIGIVMGGLRIKF